MIGAIQAIIIHCKMQFNQQVDKLSQLLTLK